MNVLIIMLWTGLKYINLECTGSPFTLWFDTPLYNIPYMYIKSKCMHHIQWTGIYFQVEMYNRNCNVIYIHYLVWHVSMLHRYVCIFIYDIAWCSPLTIHKCLNYRRPSLTEIERPFLSSPIFTILHMRLFRVN